MTIGERLVEERKKLHLTQEELGLKLNISRQAISKWESGLCLPDTANLIKLSSLFSCSVDYILRGNEREIENKEETKKDNTGTTRKIFTMKFFPRVIMDMDRQKRLYSCL